jgi:hypothetical protein
MSSFRVHLDDSVDRPQPSRGAVSYADVDEPRGLSQRPFAIAGIVILLLVIISSVVGFLYYGSLRKTPQYSLALLVDAAKADDKATLNALVDTDAIVEDFVPQISAKAVELYGRGQPPQVLQRVEKLAQPLMPAVKDRARAELPRVIRDRTERFGYVPFFAMVLGAEQYLDIQASGDHALVYSKIADRPLEIKMRRVGDRWRVIGIRDEQLATDIARKIGQEVIAVAANGSKKAADQLGIGNMSDLMRQAEELVK